MTTVWIDGDATPRAIKDILFRAAQKRRVLMILVSNQWQTVPRSKFLRTIQVEGGLDRADEYIVEELSPGDLVVTADIPLAAAAVEKGAEVLQFRGELLDASNVRQRLAVRDMMDDLRGAGIDTGGPPPWNVKDSQRFANALDRWLTLKGT